MYGGTEATSATLYLYCGHNLVNCGHNLVKPIKTAGKNMAHFPGFPRYTAGPGVGAWLQLTGALSQQYFYNDICFPSPVHAQLSVCPSVRPSVRPLAIPGPYLKLGN